MELFRKAGIWKATAGQPDWARDHGYTEQSEFPFPALYLDPEIAALAQEDPEMTPFLNQCLEQFVNHEYGHMSSLTLVENYLSRDIRKENTWMQGIYPSPRWGEVHLDLFYDMGLFHRKEVAPRALALEQVRKEKADR